MYLLFKNAMEINYPEILDDKTIAIINLGANTTNVIIIEKKIPQLFLDLPIGGSIFTENLSKDLNISIDDAEKAIKGLPVKNVQPEQFQIVLNMNMQNLLEEIEKTFSFYEAGEIKEKKIESIFFKRWPVKIKRSSQQF